LYYILKNFGNRIWLHDGVTVYHWCVFKFGNICICTHACCSL